MDKTLIRNFVIFVAILLISVGTLGYSLITGDAKVDKIDDLVQHTHAVIVEAEQVSTYVEGMLASQRGYLLTGDKSFLETYELKKAKVSDSLSLLSELITDNPSQQTRLDEIRDYLTQFTTKVEERAVVFDPTASREHILDDTEVIQNLKDNISRVNQAILNEEYTLLEGRVQAVNKQKSEYFVTLIAGLAVATVIILLFNGFLYFAQRKRARAENALRTVEDRFKLAIEGTQDGIFDWDLEKDIVHYSSQFFGMLGYEKKSITGKPESFKDLVHPEDVETVWGRIEQYINNELSEYSCEFRMKHESGRWVWIHATAKGIFDNRGKATRLVGAHTDISAVKLSQQKLELEKQAAMDANHAKSEFLAHMSHEIRTPLTAISGIAEIFSKQLNTLDDKQQHLVRTLSSSTASLKELINDILDFSKIESGELELDEQAFELETVLKETIDMMAIRANEKGISFVFDYNEIKDAEFYGDSKRIRQILVNLISNAIKFTDEGGVTIKALFEERDGVDFMRLNVSDTGIGISPEDFDLVFERFKQADSSVSRKYGGTGLGLPISKKLATLMGGNIFLSSEPGKGSTFSVLLPIKFTAEAKDKKQAINTKKLNDKIIASLSDKTKVLIVDDYEGNLVVVGYLLEDIGILYDVARTGIEAVEKWSNNHYDVVLMDVQMPEMDGFSATTEIRALEQRDNLARTPIIGMTAHALVGDKNKCIDAGMDSYLPKPLVEADLKREILKYLERKKEAA